MKLIKKEDYKKLATDLKESEAVSNLMVDFPPICMQDPLDVRVSYILKHHERTGETIRMEDVRWCSSHLFQEEEKTDQRRIYV